MTTNRFLTMDAGYRGSLVPTLLEKGHLIRNMKPVNLGHHLLIETVEGKRFCFIYKREKFLSFDRQFPHLSGQGESINIDRLYWCLDHHIDEIIICYPNGSLYSFKPQEWLDYANKNCTFRKVETKRYDKRNGRYVPSVESTASICLTELKRFDNKYKNEGV